MAGSGGALAPMPGVIDKVLVEVGQSVKANEPMVVMVAMKMEYIIRCALLYKTLSLNKATLPARRKTAL